MLVDLGVSFFWIVEDGWMIVGGLIGGLFDYFHMIFGGWLKDFRRHAFGMLF